MEEKSAYKVLIMLDDNSFMFPEYYKVSNPYDAIALYVKDRADQISIWGLSGELEATVSVEDISFKIKFTLEI